MKYLKMNRFDLRITALVFSILLFFTVRSNACTSYAVYGNKIYYGMNFDYPDVEILFTITQTQNFKIFQAFFIQNGDTSVICGMNSSREGNYNSFWVAKMDSAGNDIWDYTQRAKILLADLTGKNANVFYELGLAHAAGKPVILVTGSIDDVPFDLRALRVIEYDKNAPDWGKVLKGKLSFLHPLQVNQNKMWLYSGSQAIRIQQSKSVN